MTIPNKYRKSSETAIASYDFSDIAEGTGIVRTGAFTAELSGATILPILSSAVVGSTPQYSFGSGPGSDTNWHLVKTIDFDKSPLFLPLIYGGDFILEFSHLVNCGPSSATASAYVRVKVIKVSNSIETLLGSAETVTVTNPGFGLGSKYRINTILINIPRTKFKVGDILRIRVDLWAKANDLGATGSCYLAHDPLAREIPGLFDAGAKTSFNVYTSLRVQL